MWLRVLEIVKKEETAVMPTDRYLIVGLGNPGQKYKNNRHNIGFMAVDRVAEKFGIALNSVKNKAIVGNGRIHQHAVILAKPQTFMNLSGDSVGAVANFYKIPPEKVLVVYDELDLPFGAIRLREQGGAGGHNGMKSIINHLGQEFPRLRLGIGRPPGRMDPAAWVLRDFGDEERPLLNEILDEALQAIETFLMEGIQLAMSRHNKQLPENGEQ